MTTITFDETDAGAVVSIIKSLGHNLRINLTEKIMSQLSDLQAAIDAEDASISAVLALVSSEIAQIQDLQAQLAAALASVPDLAPIIADVQAKTAALVAVLPTPTPAP